MLGFMVERASVFVTSRGGGRGKRGVSCRVLHLESVARRVGAASTKAFVHPKPRRVLGFFCAGGIRAVDAPTACATPRAWSTEVGPGPPRLRVRESGGWDASERASRVRSGHEEGSSPLGSPRGASNRKMAAARRPTPVFVGGLGKSQSPFVRFVPDAPSTGDRFASVAASEAASDSVGCGRASSSVERRRRVRDGRRDVSGLRENGLRHFRRITHASGATSVRPFRSERSIERGLYAKLISADGLRVMRCDLAATVASAFPQPTADKSKCGQALSEWRAARVSFRQNMAPKQTSVVGRGAAGTRATQRGTPPRPRLCTSLPPRSIPSLCPPPPPHRAASCARRRLAKRTLPPPPAACGALAPRLPT